MIIAADALAAMLVREIKHRYDRQAGLVCAGVETFDEYREAIGYLKALKEVNEVLDKIIRTNGDIQE